MELTGTTAKVTLTPHLISPAGVWQAISGTESQSLTVSAGELAPSACWVIMEPQSEIEASAWPSTTLDIATADPLITRSNDSNTEMIGRFFVDILISSTKLLGHGVRQTTHLSVPMILAFFYFNDTTPSIPEGPR
ncbi:hypothetical protein [Marinobacter alexandrii]|jgi:hypothetical protein|uniref:hypothetical protein n=1 Tax=Marinobacter alexandrii TaxID=2570351 RepID=UPI002ABDB76C|nr:hypothetical protein [Marinobacter alexandrii]